MPTKTTPMILDAAGQPVVSAERVRLDKMVRFNPTAGLTPDVLARQLLGYSRGEIKALAWTMEWMEQHDDTISSVAAKAKSAVSRYGWDVLPNDDLDDGQTAQAEAQADALRAFYHALDVGHAVDGDERGGMRLMIQQVMDGYGKGSSVHHIVWRPDAEAGLGAEAIFVPLWFFESTEGRLRFLPSQWSYRGTDLEEFGGRQAWMVSRGRGVMLACAIAWMFKHIPLQDWLTYCDRHGMPGFLGKTMAEKDSEGWEAMKTAVGSMGAEFGAVISQNDAIEVLDLTASGDIPYGELVDRMDRAITILWRGGDLSTMSRGGSEKSVGANPQEDATDELDADNALWAGETIDRQLSRAVLDYHFGPGAPQLARLTLRTRTREDEGRELAKVETAVRLGVRVSKAWFVAKFGIDEAAEGDEEDVLQAARTPVAAGVPGDAEGAEGAEGGTKGTKGTEEEETPPGPSAANARLEGAAYYENTLAAALGVRARVLDPIAPLIDRLAALGEQGDLTDAEFLAFVEDAARSLPELFDPRTAAELAGELESALGTAALRGARQSLREAQ